MLERLSDLIYEKYLSTSYLLEGCFNDDEINTLLLKAFLIQHNEKTQ